MSFQINRRQWLKTSAFSAATLTFLPLEFAAREQTQTNLIRLTSNEKPYGFSPNAKQALPDTLAERNRYANPETVAKLEKQIAIRENLKPENIVLGAGSGEVLCMTAAFRQKEIVAPDFSFSDAFDAYLVYKEKFLCVSILIL